MHVLVFHGYLLRGTGSNIYNVNLVAALAGLGHQVDLLCQDRGAEALPFVDAVGSWSSGQPVVRVLREPVRVTVWTPDIGDVLPTYVADDYEGFDARPFPQLSSAELQRYLDANVAAVRDVAARARPDVALANHAVAGPAILARALDGSVPYAVKVHGSALEYTVKPHPDVFLPLAREGLGAAAAVLVGSRHTAESLWAVIGDDALPARTRLGPPGVDVDAFRPRAPEEVAAALPALADSVACAPPAWGREPTAAALLRDLDPAAQRLVGYVGKLIVSKGVDLLLAAWPLVVGRVPDAGLVVVGFGTYRPALSAMVEALRARDLEALRNLARSGREAEGGPAGELRYLAAFLDSLTGERREAYLDDAPAAAASVRFTGRLDHAELPALLPGFAAQVVPSTFPEAFGMVAAEAAACGVLPLSADHSGLAEVTRTLASVVAPDVRPLLSFHRGDGAVEEIADKLVRWLTLPPQRRADTGAALAAAARERYSWQGVARGVLAAAQGRLDTLSSP